MKNSSLHSTADYMRLLLESSSEGVIACDNDFNITFANRRAYEIHGVPINEDPNKWDQYCEIFEANGITPTPFEDLPLNRILNGDNLFNSYHLLKRKELPSVFVKYNSRPLIDVNGERIGAIVTAEDSQDLAATQARFKAIFEQSPLSIQILNKEGKTILVNKSYQKLWGITEEFVNEFVLKKYNILEDELLIKSGEIEYVRRAYKGEVVHLKPFLYDPASIGMPGRARWAGGIIYPLKNERDEVLEVVIIHQDITDEKSALEEKDKVLAQIEAILKQMPAGIMVSDSEGKVSIYNEQMTRLVGEPTNAQHTFKEILSSSMKGEVCTLKEIKHITEEQLKYITTCSGPIYDSEGKISASVLIASDITKQKRNELNLAFLTSMKSLLVSSMEYETVLNQIGNAVIPFLSDGCIIDVVDGDSYKRIVTRHVDPEKEAIFISMRNKFPLSPRGAHPSITAMENKTEELIVVVTDEVIRRRTVNEEHFQMIKDLGSKSHIVIPLQVRGKILGAINFFLTNPDRPHFDEVDFELGQNIARFASLMIENTKLYKEARSGLQLRDDFISIASHELRTPITSLNLQVEVLNSLVDGLNSDSEIPRLLKKFLDSTNNQLARLARLVDDMLDISRINSGKLSLHLRKTNVKKLVLDVLDRFKDQLRSLNIEVSYDCSEDITLNCDPERIDQVITNFMTNAIRYGKKKPIHISVSDTEDNVIFKVRDFGRGVEKEDQARIFNRFERAHTSEDVSGLGLGLYINRQIVEEHKGKISLESEPGEGSTFIVELPKNL
ncbi:MAG: ATP-binding protein [Bacteriovoracia bacterium]